MPISALPTPPSRNNPANFSTQADAFLGALPTFANEANALAVEAQQSVIDAQAAASAAIAGANAPRWVSGTTYTQGTIVWSPITFLSYRRKTNGAGTTDPSADTTNWQLASSGDVTLTGIQTITNKTIANPTLNSGFTEGVFAVTGTTPALSPLNGSIQTWTLSATSTPSQGTWNSGQSLTLMVDDGSGATIVWTSLAVTWKTNEGTAPTLNTTGFTVIQLWKVGSVIYGARVGDA